MRKLLLIAIAAVLVAALGPLPAASAEKPKRVVRTLELDYECPCGTRVGGWAAFGVQWGFGGVTFETAENERYLQIAFYDQTAQAVAAKVAQDTVPGNLSYEVDYDVCGATDEPLEIEPGVHVDVYIYRGTCADMVTPSFPTEGVVNVMLSNQV